jgi:hypothetical protein
MESTFPPSKTVADQPLYTYICSPPDTGSQFNDTPTASQRKEEELFKKDL